MKPRILWYTDKRVREPRLLWRLRQLFARLTYHWPYTKASW